MRKKLMSIALCLTMVVGALAGWQCRKRCQRKWKNNTYDVDASS